MKTIMRSKIVRTLCQFLVVAMLATIIPNNLTMSPVSAQSGTRLEDAVGTRKVAVIDFINDSNKFGNIVATNATDEFIMEVEKESRAFEIVSDRNEIEAAMSKLNVRHPVSKIDAVRVAEELDVEGLVEGFIRKIDLHGKGSSRTADVTLVVQYIDRITGEVMVGVETMGSSAARIGFNGTDEDLVLEAMKKAIFAAVEKMSTYVVPSATIYMSESGDRVILNSGVRAGLKVGMRMVVTRHKTVIGYIEIIQVNTLDSIAKIISQKIGMKPEDVCSAVYSGTYISKYSAKDETLSGVNTSESLRKSEAKSKGNSAIMVGVGIAALVGLVALFSSSGKETGPSSSSGSTAGSIKIKKVSGNLAGKVIGLNMYRQASNGNQEPMWEIITDGSRDMTINVFQWNPEASGTTPLTNIQYDYWGEWVINASGGSTIAQTSKAFNPIKWTRLDPVSVGSMTFGPQVYYDDVLDGKDVPTWTKATNYDTNTVSLVYKVAFSTTKPGVASKEFSNITSLAAQDTVKLSNTQCRELATWVKSNQLDIAQDSGLPWDCMWTVSVRNSKDSASNSWTTSDGKRFEIIPDPIFHPEY